MYLQSYQVVYDVRLEEQVSFWSGMLVGVLFGLLGLAVLIGTFVVRDKAGIGGLRLLGAVILAAVLWGGYQNRVTRHEEAESRRRLDSGEYMLVEGVVTQYRPGNNRKGRGEEWLVASEEGPYRYHLRARVVEPEDRERIGRVREGSRVRIADVDGRIARLELVSE